MKESNLYGCVYQGGLHFPLSNVIFRGFPDSSVDKESTCKTGNPGSIPGSGRSTGEGKGYSLQYSVLENFMNCGAWGHKELDITEQLSLSPS